MTKIDIKHGLIAVLPDPKQQEEDLEILHFCGYESKPGKNEIESLHEELKNDESFGLIDVAENLVIIPAPPDIVQYYRNMIKEENLDWDDETK